MSCFLFLKRKLKSHRWHRPKPSPPPQSSSAISLPEFYDGTAGGRSEPSTDKHGEKSKSSGSAMSARSIPELYQERSHNLREFGLAELKAATADFSQTRKLGEGGFGSVYKGFIRQPLEAGKEVTPLPVAVKKLNHNGTQGHKQWVAEVQFLAVVEHPNLVKLIGYCAADDERGAQRLLVYEFMPNHTLDDHLFNHDYPILPWLTRLQIAIGAAEGLHYLHEGLEVQVIYRDFKAANVLLDMEFRPKLSDFGLAREGPVDGRTHVTTEVMGTFGYAAPDYVQTGHLTMKSDVWSFGVVLYEILTGRRSVDKNRPRHEQKLLDWVKQYPIDGRRFALIIDPRLENRYSAAGVREVARLANDCLEKRASDRPTMSEVVTRLRKAAEFEELDGDVGSALPPEETADTKGEDEGKGGGVVESARRRRMLHLAKLGTVLGNVEGAAGPATPRRFVVMQGGMR